MKINLLLNDYKHIVNGYVNCDPFANGPNSRAVNDPRITSDVTNLDKICENGEAEELIARHILDYFPIAEVGQIMYHWLKKVKLGGTIIIQEYDEEEVAYALYSNKITLKEFQKIIHGKQELKWQVKKSGLSILPVIQFFKENGCKIIKKRLEGMVFVVEAQRIE